MPYHFGDSTPSTLTLPRLDDPEATEHLTRSDLDEALDAPETAGTEAIATDAGPAHAIAPEEAEPTTLAIPVLGGTEAIVLDEPVQGQRSAASLAISSRRAALALATLAVVAFATATAEGTIVALSPVIAGDLGVSVATVGMLATAFALTVMATATPLTMLTAKLDRRATLGATLGIWTAGIVVTATATGIGQLATGRIITAAAHALVWAILAPTAASLFAPHLGAKSLTRIMIGGAAAGIVGTPVVSYLGQSVGWRAPYVVLGVLGVALTASLIATLPRSAPASADAPTIRGDLPSGTAFARVLAVAFVAAAGMTATWTYIVSYYTSIGGLSSAIVPFVFALGGIVGVAATLAVTSFLGRHTVGTVAAGLGLTVLSWTAYAIGSPAGAVTGQILQSAGWAVIAAGLLHWAMRHTPWRTEVGASVYTVAINSGAAVGPLLGALVVATWGIGVLPYVSLGAMVIALAIVATVRPTSRRELGLPRAFHVALQRAADLQRAREEWIRRTTATVAMSGRAVRMRRASQEMERRRDAAQSGRVTTL